MLKKFFQLVKDHHGQAESMTEDESMQNFQQLLTGPAADSYARMLVIQFLVGEKFKRHGGLHLVFLLTIFIRIVRRMHYEPLINWWIILKLTTASLYKTLPNNGSKFRN